MRWRKRNLLLEKILPRLMSIDIINVLCLFVQFLLLNKFYFQAKNPNSDNHILMVLQFLIFLQKMLFFINNVFIVDSITVKSI